MSDELGEDDPTVIDGNALLEEFDTPETIPRCLDCGNVVFLDDLTELASAIAMGLFTRGQCVRSRPGARFVWRWCASRHEGVFKLP